MAHGNAPAADHRPLRTREALQSALVVLALRERYAAIRVADILATSGVGRSTFYEHYAGKDALLAACLERATSTLAGLPFDDATVEATTALLEHFWQERQLARGLLQGRPLFIFRRALLADVEARLITARADTCIPRRLAARLLAESLVAPMLAWLGGEAMCAAADLAKGLHRASHGSLMSLARGDASTRASPATDPSA